MKRCPLCRRTFAAHEIACPTCGARLVASSPAGKASPALPPPVASPPSPAQRTPRPLVDPLVGQALGGRFRVLSRIGSGGMADVYLARHEVLERNFAVKVLRREVAEEERFVRRFLREAKIASLVEHENIVYITDFGRTPDGRCYLVMEYLSGACLDEVIERQGALPVGRGVHILRQIASALAKAHSLGIIHRDLKPGNVLLVQHRGDPDFVKLLDFGIAKLLQVEAVALSLQGEVFGTPHYMAPEQINGLAIDHRIDIYAFGVLAFELLSGELPFAGNLNQVMLQHLETAPPSLGERLPGRPLSPLLQEVVARCLRKHPGERFQSAAEMLALLEQIPVLPAAGAAVGPGPGAGHEHDSRATPRRSVVAAAAAAACASASGEGEDGGGEGGRDGGWDGGRDGDEEVGGGRQPMATLRVERGAAGRDRGTADRDADSLAELLRERERERERRLVELRQLVWPDAPPAAAAKLLAEMDRLEAEERDLGERLALAEATAAERDRAWREQEAELRGRAIDLGLDRTTQEETVLALGRLCQALRGEISEEGQLTSRQRARQAARDLRDAERKLGEASSRVAQLNLQVAEVEQRLREKERAHRAGLEEGEREAAALRGRLDQVVQRQAGLYDRLGRELRRARESGISAVAEAKWQKLARLEASIDAQRQALAAGRGPRDSGQR